jgi:hypothetical protein
MHVKVVAALEVDTSPSTKSESMFPATQRAFVILHDSQKAEFTAAGTQEEFPRSEIRIRKFSMWHSSLC